MRHSLKSIALSSLTFSVLSSVSFIAPIAISSAQAQDAAAPYKSAVRYDIYGRSVGTIASDPDNGGPLKHAATRTTYDVRGNVIKVETGELASWQDETIAPKDWSGFTILSVAHSRYDLMNRPIKQWGVGSDGVTVSLTQTSYDGFGRPLCTAQRMNSALFTGASAYDGVDACTLGSAGADGPDRINKIRYDDKGQVVQMRRAVGTPLEQAEVTYAYTENRQKKLVIDANGNKAEYFYDGHDRLTQWRFPSQTKPSNYNDATPQSALASAGSSSNIDYEQYGYDANGNRTFLRKRDGFIITYQYDALNRNIAKIIPERSNLDPVHTRDVHYEYDLRGLQVKARFDSINGPGIDNAYDGFGRMTSSTNSMFATPKTLSYIYDDNSNRTQITHDDGKGFTYRYDNLNRETAMRLVGGGYIKNSIYNNRGNIWLLGVGSGAINGYQYDNAGRLNRINTALAGTDADNQFNFGYNPASQIKSRTISNDAYANTAHYDVARNYTTNGLNQYTGAGPSSFAYDPNGNLTSDGAVSFTYDVENRLVEASGARNAEIIYDPLGRLWEVNQGSSATTTRFLYDGDALIAEYDGLGNMLRRYVHGGGVDQPLLWYEGDGTDSASQRGLFANHQGSIAAVADSTGNAIAINGYDSYGIPNETNQGRFQYTGQIWLPELGLYYYKARIYSPTLGRFLQTDPIGYEDQYNLYAYVGNDPVNKIDPTGTTCTLVGEGDQQQADCRIDEVAEIAENGEISFRAPNDRENRRFRRFNRNYTDAVNRLLENPDRETTIEPIDGDKGGFTISAGEAAQNLIGRQFTFIDTDLGGDKLLGTRDGPGTGSPAKTIVFPDALKGAGTVAITHDGAFHASSQENSGGLQSVLGTNVLNQAHQSPYNQAACALLGVRNCATRN